MSTLYVDNLQPNLGSRVMAAGHVVQVKNLTYTDTFSQSITDGAVNNLQLSITPTSSTSKILIQAQVFFEASVSDHSIIWYLQRDSTRLAAPASGARKTGISMAGTGFWGDDNSSTPATVNINYYDEPATTSQVTYRIGAHPGSAAATFYINRSIVDSDSDGYERGISSITIMEIAQ